MVMKAFVVVVVSVLTASASASEWLQRNLVEDQGHELKDIKHGATALGCMRECDAMSACHSFSFSPSKSRCHLKDKCVKAADRHRWNEDYVTYYKPCSSPAPSPPPSPAPSPPAPASGTTWAVIAVGSSGYGNYRHQADACHAYQILRKKGIPEDQIILMMADDAAGDSHNPFPGKLFNKPGDGPNVTDVYEGCKVDYKRNSVTAKLFLSVITGDEAAVHTIQENGKVLKSTSSDRVFLYYVDHGGVNIVAFPSGPLLHNTELATALKTMQEKKMYSEVLFYMEACESGSMFPNLPTDSKIFAVTASNAHESSWGYYCMPDDKVNGKHLNTCLGDLFSISWMEDTDLGDSQETIETQVQRVTQRVTKSHVLTFGDKSFEDKPFGDFELRVGSPFNSSLVPAAVGGAWDVRDIPLKTAYYEWEAETDAWGKSAAFAKLERVVQGRHEDEKIFRKVAEAVCKGMPYGCEYGLHEEKHASKDLDCHYDLVDIVHKVCPKRAQHNPGGWNSFNMRFSQMLVNVCEKRGQFKQHMDALKKIMHAECSLSARSWQAMTAAASDSAIVV